MSIQQLIAEGEHQQQDFKFRIDDARKIARTLVAFANTDGGRLLVGVKDNGSVVGVKTEEEFYVAEAAARLYAKPEIPFEARVWKVDNRSVLEVYVPPSSTRPHQAQNDQGDWRAYVRQKDQNLEANGVLIKVWALGQRSKPAEWSYTKAEETLFECLREQSCISISTFQKRAKIRRFKAEHTLARLVSWGVIEMKFDGQSWKYCETED